MKYKIEFNETQLRTVATALEFYSRFLAGQWEIPDAMQWKEYDLQGKQREFWEKRNHIEEQFKILSQMFTGLHHGEYYGIGSDMIHEGAKIAYDIYRPILEQLAKESRERDDSESISYSVYDYPGLSYSKEGRIEVNPKTTK